MTRDLRRAPGSSPPPRPYARPLQAGGTLPQPLFDGVPHQVVNAANQAYERREVRTVVAEVIEKDERSRAHGRELAFSGASHRITVRLLRAHGLLGLCVLVQPPTAMTVLVRHNGPHLTGVPDAAGRCFFGAVQPGHVSLLLTEDSPDRSRSVATAWAIV